MSVHSVTLVDSFEAMTEREKREALRDIKRENFRSALWALSPEMSRAEIRELFESEMSQ